MTKFHRFLYILPQPVRCDTEVPFFSVAGIQRNPEYWKLALEGHLSIFSFTVLLWCVYAAVYMGLESKALKSEKAAATLLLQHSTQSVKQFCVNQTRVIWDSLPSLLHLTEEQVAFFITKCLSGLIKVSEMRESVNALSVALHIPFCICFVTPNYLMVRTPKLIMNCLISCEHFQVPAVPSHECFAEELLYFEKLWHDNIFQPTLISTAEKVQQC